MAVSIVRLGSPRGAHEGPRLGTVRRPPRGVPKSEFARRDFYDVWVPDLAPSTELVTVALAAQDERSWQAFSRRYRTELLGQPAASRLLALLATLSHTSAFAVGCYCADEQRCHRSILRLLLRERGALLA